MNPDLKQTVTTVTPLSKYLAMALFIIMPFVGVYIGYQFAPEKVVEVERVVEVEKQAEYDWMPLTRDEQREQRDRLMSQADQKNKYYSIGQSFLEWQIYSTSSSGYIRHAHLTYSGEPIEGKLRVAYSLMGGGGLVVSFTPENLGSALPDFDTTKNTVVWSLQTIPVNFGSSTATEILSDFCGRECLLSVEDGFSNAIREYDVILYPTSLTRAYYDELGQTFESLEASGIEKAN